MKLLTNSKSLLDCLSRINIFTSEDIFNRLPYRYEDMSYTDEYNLIDGQKVTLLGKLVSNPKVFKNGRIDIITFYFVSNNGKFYNVKIFNRSYLMKSITLGEEYTLTGTFSLKKKEVVVINFVKGKIESEKSLRPVYHLTSDTSITSYRKLIEKTFNEFGEMIIDELPNILKEKYRLLDKKDALRMVHLPKNEEEINLGMRTLKYHECLLYCIKNQIIRGENKRIPEFKGKQIPTEKINEFILSLPYKLTSDQIVSIREIILDMNHCSLMYRLLQGDVGTGKTIVSAISLYGNYLRDKIGAFMVPTDSLARQQYEDLKNLFSPYGIKVDLLIGSMTLKEKNEVKRKLKNGEIDIIVGTHALFSQDVEYYSLGLVVIDEQHRFGVNQRNELISKDDSCDLLLMSATPIPRTLALSIYGDLDISTLSTFPSGKKDITTKIVSPQSMMIFSTINDCISENRQVFIVAPKIKDVDDSLSSAEKLYETYQILYKDQVRLLHGKMKSEEKNELLKAFINKEFLILVSTTVVELGINVLDAKAIIIYSSSHFGLASLHQLRGRVGRNGLESICLLVDEDVENKRLKVLEESLDGFYIAEMDMKMRGPGDATGVAQSGFPTFFCLNIVDDFKMFECARDDATKIINNLEVETYLKYYKYALDKICEEKDITLFD